MSSPSPEENSRCTFRPAALRAFTTASMGCTWRLFHSRFLAASRLGCLNTMTKTYGNVSGCCPRHVSLVSVIYIHVVQHYQRNVHQSVLSCSASLGLAAAQDLRSQAMLSVCDEWRQHATAPLPCPPPIPMLSFTMNALGLIRHSSQPVASTAAICGTTSTKAAMEMGFTTLLPTLVTIDFLNSCVVFGGGIGGHE